MTPSAADRDMDALVAEHVMGWKPLLPFDPATQIDPITSEFYRGPHLGFVRLEDAKGVFLNSAIPRYSTDISNAWLVIERLRGEWNADVHSGLDGWGELRWTCDFDNGSRTCTGSAAEAPLAICQAALAVKGVYT